MNPEHHRQLAAFRGICGRVDVQEQAILAGSAVREDHVVEGANLGAVRAELRRVALALPLRRRLRRLPAQIAHRRRCIGQPQKRLDLAVVEHLAMHFAMLGLYRQRVGLNRRRQPQRQPRHSKSAYSLRSSLHRKILRSIVYSALQGLCELLAKEFVGYFRVAAHPT